MRLKLQNFGSDCEGIRLNGDKRNPEPDHVRIAFPGGEVDVVRTTDGEYWVHLHVDTPEGGDWNPGESTQGVIKDARLDIRGRHSADIDCGEFADPRLYHVALRVGVVPA